MVKKQSELSLNKILKYSKISCMQVSLTTYMECKHSLIKKKTARDYCICGVLMKQNNRMCVYSSICYKNLLTQLQRLAGLSFCGESSAGDTVVSGTTPVQCLAEIRPNKSQHLDSSLKAGNELCTDCKINIIKGVHIYKIDLWVQ